MLIVGIDSGREQTKVWASNGKKLIFPSIVGEFRETPLLEGKDKPDYEIVINNKEQYFVGELAELESDFGCTLNQLDKIQEETRILQITAAAAIAKSGDSINLLTGVPIDQYSKETKEKLSKMLLGAYEVTISGKTKKFTIDNISLAPEGCAAYWDVIMNENGQMSNSPYRKGLVRILDIGSRTINFGTVKDGKFINRLSNTLPFGYRKMTKGKIQTPSDEDKEKFIRKIETELSLFDIELKNEAILLAGGGAIALQKQLINVVPYANILNGPVYANARGYMKLGMIQWQGK